MMVNGMLAGLVAITAPCAFVAPWAAVVIGVIAGVLVIDAVFFIERRGVDDPVGAIAVHGVCGIFGVLAVGIFANGSYGGRLERLRRRRASTASSTAKVGQLGAQALGALVICTVIFGIAYAFFKIQNTIMKGGIRPSAEVEIEGVDIPEMGVARLPRVPTWSEHGPVRQRRSPTSRSASRSRPDPPTALTTSGGHGPSVPARCASPPRSARKLSPWT